MTAPCCSGAAMLYKTIMADPPWPYHSSDLGSTRAHRPNTPEETRRISAKDRYDLMTVGDIKAMPIEAVAAENAHLYLWTTNSFMVEAHEVARAWGFKPKTIVTWGKVRKADRANFEPSMKMGYWFRSATEHCLFAVRGKLRFNEGCEALPTLFLDERLQHSAKPEGFRSMVEKASPGPYLELFARKATLGWDVWGNQAPDPITFALEGRGD